MNVQDLIKRVEAHKAEHGNRPIMLAENIWHAAKQAYSLHFGEGTMFPHPDHPESFMVAGVPLVCDQDEPEANADGLLPTAPAPGDNASNADPVLKPDGTSAAIADLATQAGPAIDPAALHAGAPQARAMEGQPRPELDDQVAIEHFADHKGEFTHPDELARRAAVREAKEDETAKVIENPVQANGANGANDANEAEPAAEGFKALSRKADADAATNDPDKKGESGR